jgi:hypothetical protein
MNRKAAISALEDFYYSLPADEQGDIPCAVTYWQSLTLVQLAWEVEEVLGKKVTITKE